jgi:hypothetical protein
MPKVLIHLQVEMLRMQKVWERLQVEVPRMPKAALPLLQVMRLTPKDIYP